MAYAFAVVRHAAIDLLRGGAGPVSMEVPIYDGEAANPASQAIDAERRAAISRALSELSGEQRQLIVLKLYAELTFEQIAETLGEPLGTVTSRYHRTLRRLQDKLEPEP